MKKQCNCGFTLIELMITLTVLAILAALAAPAMTDFVEKRRLIGAAEEAYSHLQFARSETIKQSTDIFARFTTNGTTTWCFGLSTATNCDCTVTNPATGTACTIPVAGTRVLKRISSGDYPQISMINATTEVQFDRIRGIVPGGGNTIRFTSPKGWELRILVSALGRVRMCSPAGTSNVGGYPTC